MAASELEQLSLEDVLPRNTEQTEANLDHLAKWQGANNWCRRIDRLEICRQLVTAKLTKIILVEQNEFNLFAIENELQEKLKTQNHKNRNSFRVSEYRR